MIKNEKGFTLVELLAIILILAIITLVAAPNMTNLISKEEEETQNVLNTKIENAAKLYAAKYYANDIIGGIEISFTLEDLENDGLLRLKKSECKDGSGNTISGNIIIDSSNKYNYNDIRTISGVNCYDCNKAEDDNTCY